ncbi:MAG: hypothetical protein HQK54_13720, partial [Oligoflexales bacterium]|nr:hypothetical protein [Oligoflexales bacterium]
MLARIARQTLICFILLHLASAADSFAANSEEQLKELIAKLSRERQSKDESIVEKYEEILTTSQNALEKVWAAISLSIWYWNENPKLSYQY